MALSANEQYLLELINRARLDPVGEAARYGISLNTGLAAGQLGTQVRQVLAPNALLENAAISHSKWMIASDVFSHTEASGSTPASRATSAGYVWSNVAENIAWRGTTATIDMTAAIDQQHQDLFLSPGHRVNLLYDTYREVGLAQEGGRFAYSGNDFDSSMVTELFGKSGSKVFLTGVAYADSDNNNFYTVGEGQGSVSIAAQGQSTTTASAGGYALGLSAASVVAVTGSVGTLKFSANVSMLSGNAKLDVVDGNTLFSSATIALGAGINNATLLGAGALNATGNGAANILIGNSAANTIAGGAGADRLFGGAGKDILQGNYASDALFGGAGADRLNGGVGNDELTGGADRDCFVFCNNMGDDRVTDFSVAASETLVFDNAIWGGSVLTAAQVVNTFASVVAGNVVFEFSPTESVTLAGVNSTAGLAALIQLI